MRNVYDQNSKLSLIEKGMNLNERTLLKKKWISNSTG